MQAQRALCAAASGFRFAKAGWLSSKLAENLAYAIRSKGGYSAVCDPSQTESGATIIAERQGQPAAVAANGASEAVFSGLRSCEYTLRVASDGDLPDDPKVLLHGEGCLDVSLFRALRITGRVATRTGAPASRLQVQFSAYRQQVW